MPHGLLDTVQLVLIQIGVLLSDDALLEQLLKLFSVDPPRMQLSILFTQSLQVVIFLDDLIRRANSRRVFG